ncbi:sensor domain-containing diguanylate cyclase [Shewanella sedimentimangrovi]|uniref:diguanylate cyclase n=1 Tax=Shewanella sedimentimangrovi TaxID=2814293 RepID=A0ABX7QXU7_9GAMM|nr:diguanylate cyclase [Shewanella sedimentimangrovi]QSX36348.1 diguanylate cyclase [Shewanella sedimentimangrovi]
MKLNHFSLLLIGGLTLLSSLTAFVLFGVFLRPELAKEIRDQQQMEVRALTAGLEFYKRPLKTFAFDYAVWDEMVDFIRRPSDTFIESNLYPAAFSVADIDAAMLFDPQGKVIWQYQGIPAPLPRDIETHPLWFGGLLPSAEEVASARPSTRTGLLRSGNKVVLFSNAAVLPSDGDGPVVGSFMVIRAIKPSLTDELQRLTLVDFNLDLAQPRLHKQLSLLTEDSRINEIRASHTWLLNDVLGQPAMVLTLRHKKSEAPAFFSKEASLIFFTFISVFLCGLLPITLVILNPLRAINRVLVKMTSRGRLIKMKPQFFIEEISRVAQSFNQLADMLERHQNYLESLSLQDPLTGIANRRGLEAFASRAHEEWLAGKGTIGFLMLDLDEFKSYNDSLGHTEGDKALLTIAQALLIECRRRGELVTRFGGEEFCVVIHGDNLQQMERLANRMLERVRELQIVHPKGQYGLMTVSIGGIFYEHFHPQFVGVSWHDMLAMADKQLYIAKSEGRNRLSLRYMQAAKLVKSVS